MSSVLNWLTTNIFTQSALFMGILTIIGNLLIKKKPGEIIEAFISTILGYYIFNTGTGTIATQAALLGNLIKPTFGVLAGVVPSSNALFTSMANATEYLAPRVIPCFIVCWLLHILLVKFIKPLKVVYLTMHNMISFTSCFLLFFYNVVGLRGLALDIAAILPTLIYITLTPMLVYKDCMDVTGGAFALGHFNQIGTWIGSKLSVLFAKNAEKEDAEKLTLPGWLSNMAESGMSIGAAMPVAYLFVWVLVVLINQPDAVALLSEKAGSLNTLVYMLLASFQLSAAVYVLLYGLRMFMGGLLPAFQGITEKWLPDCAPGIDTVAFYSLAPNGILICMFSYMLGETIVCLGAILLKAPIIPIIGYAFAFSECSALGAIANKKGGWKACVLAGLVEGALAMVGVCLFVHAMGLTEQGVSQGNVDSSMYPALVCYLARMIFNKW